jgi:hypothetical protein
MSIFENQEVTNGIPTILLFIIFKINKIIFAYRILVGNPEGKRPLGRPRRR